VVAAEVDHFSSECLACAQLEFGEKRGEFLVNGDPKLLLGLALDDGDESLIDVAPLHDEDIRHALAGVERQRSRLPEIGAGVLAKMLYGVPRPRGPPLATILQPIKAGEMARIGPAEVRDRYGVEPAQVPDFIALRGDASDKIPGAKGVGAKTAAGLLMKYRSLENMLAAGRFEAQAKELRLYRSIATMNKSAPLPSLKAQVATWAKASELAREWQLNRLADRLSGLAQASSPRQK
jgi:hypothetical protein